MANSGGQKYDQLFSTVAQTTNDDPLMEVYNERGSLNDTFRRKSINSLHITETEPQNISSLDFASLVPMRLRHDSRVANDLVKRLTEAARHRQRIARANYIQKYRARQLQRIYKDYSTREDQCAHITKLITEVKFERHWKGSMPSIEWFLRKKNSAGKTRSQPKVASPPVVPSKKSKRLAIKFGNSMGDTEVDDDIISHQNASLQPGEIEASGEADDYCDYLKMMLKSSTDLSMKEEYQQSDSSLGDGPAVSSSGVSTTIINTGELHLPYTDDLKPGTSSESGNMSKHEMVDKIENYFNHNPTETARQYMKRLRQAANRRLAEQAAEMISLLNSQESAQFLSIIEDCDGFKTAHDESSGRF